MYWLFRFDRGGRNAQGWGVSSGAWLVFVVVRLRPVEETTKIGLRYCTRFASGYDWESGIFDAGGVPACANRGCARRQSVDDQRGTPKGSRTDEEARS
jgi:hypothetical protein